MHTKLAVFAVFPLFTLMFMPAYANVTSVSLVKAFYTNEESIVFAGIESTGQQSVFVIIRDPSGGFQGMASDPVSDPDGEFSTIPRSVELFFKSKGIYNATAFTDEQKEKDGISLMLEYDGDKVFLIPDFVLSLRSISDKTIEEEKTLSFTASLTESVKDAAVYSLEKNPPTGATIDSDTGKFSWTPTKSQAPGSYTFDIVVKKGALEDRESIRVSVTEKSESVSQPTKTEPDKTKEPEPGTKEPTDLGLAPFVDETKDPQYYVDRYNNEASYKKWFDDNYSEYSSIYEAVGLEEPKEEPKSEPQIGECGPGTKFIDGKCELIESSNAEGGGCLIATAAYGSEMAPQVQLLREIRDGKVMSTESGASFMTGFNEFYYSFSPYVADYERQNPAFKELVKIGITPMLSTLSIMSMADTEQEILGYGIGVILMNIGMYVAAPAMLGFGINRLRRKVRF